MPVPKKRVGHSEQGHRRSNWKAKLYAQTTCEHCGQVNKTHCLCVHCGFYRGKLVSQKFHAHHQH